MIPHLQLLLFFSVKSIDAKVNNEIFPGMFNEDILTIKPSGKPFLETLSATSFTTSQMELENSTRKTLLKVRLQDSNLSTLVCFPIKQVDYKLVYELSHVTCRRMGFMSVSSVRVAETSSTLARRSKPKYLSCSGIQTGVPQCRALKNATDACQKVTEVICGACNGTFKGFKGRIKSSGYPFASFADVTCEWNIMVPVHHGIHLSFDQFGTMNGTFAELPCGLHSPYIQIMYGIQSQVTVQRYCRLDEVKNLSIPFNTVKIIVFTGFKSLSQSANNESGISVAFNAIAFEKENYDSNLKLVAFALLGAVFIFCIILCHYIQKHKLCDCLMKERKGRPGFLPHTVEQAYSIPDSIKLRTEHENFKQKGDDGNKTEKVVLQQNQILVKESEKATYKYSSLLDTSTGFVPCLTPTRQPEQHTKLSLIHSYHGCEDPNRLSLPNRYPIFQTYRHASSESRVEKGRKKLENSKSTL